MENSKYENTFEFDSLESLQKCLLDLTARNPLLNFSTKKTTQIEIVDEQPNQLYHYLMSEKAMTFLAVPEPTKKQLKAAPNFQRQEPGKKTTLSTPDAKEWAEHLNINIHKDLPINTLPVTKGSPSPSKHNDNAIQTLLYPTQLEYKLRNLSNKAHAAIEEKGSNILHLSLGFLEWTEKVEKNNKQLKLIRLAPLFLIPLQLNKGKLDKRTGTYRYTINYNGEDILPNISLQEKMRVDFNLYIPDLDNTTTPEEYFAQIQKIISKNQPDWSIKRYANISLLNFNKLLMYRDLDPNNWPDPSFINTHPIVGQLFSNQPIIDNSSIAQEMAKKNNKIKNQFPLIYSADSSQYKAIVKALNGDNLVMEGPPGGGKSQNITNLIAAALYQGKKVLFVAEKLAALEVVKQRLDNAGLGEFCLELHSHKSQKRKVLANIKKRIEMRHSFSKPIQTKQSLQQEIKFKVQLGSYTKRINQSWQQTDKSIYEIFTAAVYYKNKITQLPTDFHPQVSANSLSNTHQQKLLDALKQYLIIYQSVLSQSNKTITSHPWYGLNNNNLELINNEKLTQSLSLWQDRLIDLEQAGIEISIEDFNNSYQQHLDKKQQLDIIFKQNKAISIEELLRIEKQLKNYSSLHWLNPDWHKAKQQLMALVIDNKTAFDQILSKLKFLINYTQQENKYISHPNYLILKAQFKNYQQIIRYSQIEIELWKNHTGKEADTNKQLLSKLIKRNQYALDNKQTLSNWVDYIRVREDLILQGLNPIINAIEKQQITIQEMETAFYCGVYDILSRDILKIHPKLAEFNGEIHNHIQQQFCLQKQKNQQLDRQQIAWSLSQNVISAGNAGGKVSQYTELALLKHECAKKTRHIPTRQLLKRASTALLELKPCFMMSPMSVAQYLAPGKIKFDLLVIDEASQMRPEDALGAILRSHQTIIVGDPKQLPPSNFFDKIHDSSTNTTALEESESILDVVTPFFSHQQLQWHYRSQHEDLIAFSNKQFYHNKLLVFPSPQQQSKQFGVHFSYIEDGLFVKHKNHSEAEKIVNAISHHLINTPEQSLGVVSMNIKQRELIELLLDEKSKASPQLQKALENNKQQKESLFIKNLENAQGDERDVIFISCTYGKKEPEGKVIQHFGPINKPSGWRRLNVLFTRAKQKMHVFSSMLANDLTITETTSLGTIAFNL
jgi:hypothetical protein